MWSSTRGSRGAPRGQAPPEARAGRRDSPQPIRRRRADDPALLPALALTRAALSGALHRVVREGAEIEAAAFRCLANLTSFVHGVAGQLSRYGWYARNARSLRAALSPR